jgi:hypothetical protein
MLNPDSNSELRETQIEKHLCEIISDVCIFLNHFKGLHIKVGVHFERKTNKHAKMERFDNDYIYLYFEK